jgi:DNA-binding XRE family transcriptional regulator
LLKLILFGSIIIQIITLFTTIVPKLYLYDKWKGKVISENIKRLRVKLGLTQDDLAKKADIKYTTLMKVESGTVNKPSVQTMDKIAQALGVSIENLIK